MTTNEYARKIAALIDARPRRIDLDKLLEEISARVRIAERERDILQGRRSNHEPLNSKRNGSSGLKKLSPQSSYARQVVELIVARPRNINLHKLLDEIDVLAGIAESRRDQREGRWYTNEQVMEDMWKQIYSMFNGRHERKRGSIKSSKKLAKTRL
jgi:hypothetical protein